MKLQRVRVSAIAGIAIVASLVGVSAQKARPSPFVARYEVFTLKLPIAAIQLAGMSRIGSKSIGIVEISTDGRGAFVPNSHPDWKMMAMPAFGEFKFEKIGTVKGETEAEYRNSQFYLKLRFGVGVKPEDAISPFLIRGRSSSEEAVSYWNERLSAISEIFGAAALKDGLVRGTVTDFMGAVIPGVWVTATSGAILRTATTERDGTYTLKQVPPGKCIVETALQGFNKQRRAITVNLVDEGTANFVLELCCPAVR